MSRSGCGDGRCGGRDAATAADSLDSDARLRDGGSNTRGLAWLAGGFLFCPCHLPLTLWFLASVLAGTATGALLRDHVAIAGVAITAIWIGATWRGVRLLR